MVKEHSPQQEDGGKKGRKEEKLQESQVQKELELPSPGSVIAEV